jgi:hypothetical protein
MSPWVQPSRCLLGLVFAALLLPGCGGSRENRSPSAPSPAGLRATPVGSASAVAGGQPGAYYVTEDRRQFHLRCPCGVCSKSAVLPLVAEGSTEFWTLSGEPGRPTLTPSIHWLEADGARTHWHGWLRDGYFDD